MYASLIGSGVSQLYDLLRSSTSSSKASSSSSSAFDPASIGASSDTADSASTDAASSGSGKLTTDLNSLLLDLQNGSTASASASATDPNSTVAGDLQNVFGDLTKSGGAHGHHHHHGGGGPQSGAPPADGTDPTQAGSTATGGTPTASNPFQNLASSLLAYAKTQSVSSSLSASTLLTA